MYWFLVNQNKASIASVKILSIALGWSLGESIFTRLVDFYLNARSLQFDWTHLLSATEANIHLLQNISVCALLWQWNRSANKLSIVLIMVYFFRGQPWMLSNGILVGLAVIVENLIVFMDVFESNEHEMWSPIGLN
ncbi:unnamed protein product [Oppiella nova]|uniref:BOS complex subunit TMEM147 n=1 Tax=Oppiella nova TaxID=334625 RepID=A0A7R9LCS6_9ACAR|nr:unnamed protein product [Oppiella nova]CAG2161496.1 unnamed protein product [Oppiella nova]